ncbi:hypothetical protein ACS0TY_008000 [Phlomoides rotata]
MKALLVQQGLGDALKPIEEGLSALDKAKKLEMMERAYNTVILCLGDKVLREVSKEKTNADVWGELDVLYLTKSISNRMSMKQKLIAFKMTEKKPLGEQLYEFLQVVDNLENLEVTLENEDNALMLLNALPKSMESFKDTLLFGGGSLTFEDVQVALKTKSLNCSLGEKKPQKSLNVKLKNGKGKGMNRRKEVNAKNKSKTNTRKFVEKRRCYVCHQVGHLKKNCPQKGVNKEEHKSSEVDVAESGYESA